jgi:hypothetical protein
MDITKLRKGIKFYDANEDFYATVVYNDQNNKEVTLIYAGCKEPEIKSYKYLEDCCEFITPKDMFSEKSDMPGITLTYTDAYNEVIPYDVHRGMAALFQNIEKIISSDRVFNITISCLHVDSNSYRISVNSTGEDIELQLFDELEAREIDHMHRTDIYADYVLGGVNSKFKKLDNEWYYTIKEEK